MQTSTSKRKLLLLPKTINVYWLAVTVLMVWFLFVHAPPYLRAKTNMDAVFAWHLVGAYTISLVCILNAAITPSFWNGQAKLLHIWAGRLGMIAGATSFFLGAICSWWPWRAHLPPRAFAIAITLGGVYQVGMQYRGYTAIRRFQALKLQIEELQQQQKAKGAENNETLLVLIRDKDVALRRHIESMLSLFVLGCGAPAFIRVVMAVSVISPLLSVTGAIVILVGFVRLYLHAVIPKRDPVLAQAVPNDSTPLLCEGKA